MSVWIATNVTNVIGLAAHVVYRDTRPVQLAKHVSGILPKPEIAVDVSRIVASHLMVAPMLLLSTALLACSDDDPTAPQPMPNTAVAVSYCAAAAPTWVAFRDGDGSWTRELPGVSGARTTYRHVFTSERVAMASLTPVFDGQFTVLRVLYGAPADMATEGDTTVADCVGGIGDVGKKLRGSVSGLDTTQFAVINVGQFARASVFPRFEHDFTVDGVSNGPQDLLATRTAVALPPRLILRREIDLPDGSLIPTLDFESSEAFNVGTANVIIENLGTDAAVNFTQLITLHGDFMLPLASSVTSKTQPYIALPTAKLIAGDLEQLHVSTAGPAPRTADVYFRSPVDRTVTLGSAIERPSISVIASDATLRLRARFVPQADYDRQTSVVYQQPARNAFVVVSMTTAYAALNGGYDLDVPDLSSVTGFDASWALRPGVSVNWNAIRFGGTLPIGRNAVPVNGATRRTSTTQDTMTFP
jgi:hypothetical protein